MWAFEEDGDGSKMTMGNKPCDTKDQLSHMGSHVRASFPVTGLGNSERNN
jgi:hypothetical protein